MTRMIPLLAVAAVALCVALVIVVISVMTGFLDMVRASGQTLMGDVSVVFYIRGIPDYDRLITSIESRPEAAAATPVVDTWGLLRMPYPDGDAKESQQVQIWGIDPASFSTVTGFEDTLHWDGVPDNTADDMRWDLLRTASGPLVKGMSVEQKATLLRLSAQEELKGAGDEQVHALVATVSDADLQNRLHLLAFDLPKLLQVLDEDDVATLEAMEPRLWNPELVVSDGVSLTRNGEPAMVSGLHVSKANQRTHTGEYEVLADGHWWMPRFSGTLTTLPIDSRGGLLEPESIILPFANEFASGVYLIDQTRVMVPIETVQRLTHLDAAETVDPIDPTRVIGSKPARATMVLVRAADGVDPLTLRAAVRDAYRDFEKESESLGRIVPRLDRDHGLGIKTWEEQNAAFIGPVEKERELMRTLFSIVYLVCGALIVAIFWAIVYEKTRDIGILRSVGASRMGIVHIFLLYGLSVGVLGALGGVGLGWLITTNMEGIHEAMSAPPLWLGVALLVASLGVIIWTLANLSNGRLLPRLMGLLGAAVLGLAGVAELIVRDAGGFVLWDPAVYYFTDIPDAVDWGSAWVTAGGAVLVSVLAAAIPAARAADIDPVGALRYE
ncbi:MAG: ABC transporter permease [Phycisphaerales bacterium]|nr:ABC transporter permease [Phycisphaerales bacterium]